MDNSSVHHQEFFTVHTAMVYVIQVCWQLASRIRTELVPSWYSLRAVPSWSCLQAVSKPVWHIPLLCVQWKTPNDGRVEFYSKNKFEKLVHLFGVIIRTDGFISPITIYDIPVALSGGVGGGWMGWRSGRGVILTAHFLLMPRLRISVFMPPPSPTAWNMPSLRARDQQLYLCPVSVLCTVLNEVRTKL